MLCGVHGHHDEPEQHCRAVLPPVTPRGVPCTFFLVLRGCSALCAINRWQNSRGRRHLQRQPCSMGARLMFTVHLRTVDWDSLVVPSGFPPRPESPLFLCCPRVGPPPQFEPSMDRRMGVVFISTIEFFRSGQHNGCVLVVTGQWIYRTFRSRFRHIVPSVQRRPLWWWIVSIPSIGFGVGGASVERGVCNLKPVRKSPARQLHFQDFLEIGSSRTTQPIGTSLRLGRLAYYSSGQWSPVMASLPIDIPCFGKC